ncbi:uncharacterized protein LOC135157365 [Lytechinus pictus]|uniref:uncharacterized protein LOC135157365 n=1 Tax=Lytechinus pictus TaxID=7653 RepID=UPI0030B9B1BB
MLSGYKLFFSKFGREMNLEMTEAKFFRMLILMIAIHSVHMQDAGTAGQSCVDNSQPPSTTYWTDWYSTEDSLTDTGEQEDFFKVCTSIQETECRERFTHRSLDETGLSFTKGCDNGVLLCENSGRSGTGQVCVDMEMRLKCAVPEDPLPEPDFQWSLNELDSGNTRGAVRPWKCWDEPLVQLVTPIKGSIFGYVDG